MKKISILLAVVVSLLVWFVAHWVLHWPHPLASVWEIPLILAACLITLLILYAARNITEGRASDYLTQLLIMFVVGFGVAYIIINVTAPLPPPAVSAVVDCNLIHDEGKVLTPDPVQVDVGWDVEWRVSARQFRTKFWIDSFKEVDRVTKQPIPGSTKQPFPVPGYLGETTSIQAGKFYRIFKAPVVQDGHYKFTISCQAPSGPKIPADPMIEIPRP